MKNDKLGTQHKDMQTKVCQTLLTSDKCAFNDQMRCGWSMWEGDFNELRPGGRFDNRA